MYYQHTNKSDPMSPLEDPTPHIAAFMVMRQEFWYLFCKSSTVRFYSGSSGRSWVSVLHSFYCAIRRRYFFGSTGWLDGDWQWSKLYDTLSQCGAPVDKQPQGDGMVYTRKYAKCTAKVDCTDKTACAASIVGPNGSPLMSDVRETVGMRVRAQAQ